jgi:hypothetical protein
MMLLLPACATAPGARPGLNEKQAMLTAGSRCSGGSCRCRGEEAEGGDAEESGIAAGQKRFELRTGRGVDPLSITVEGRGTLVKGLEEAKAQCAYFDLPPGRHRVRLSAKAANPDAGMQPAFTIAEYGVGTHAWYGTFDFHCGESEACTKDEVRSWSEEGGNRRLADACGSVRVENVHWESERSPGTRLEDLQLELVLHVYRFDPHFSPGSAECKRHVPAEQ